MALSEIDGFPSFAWRVWMLGDSFCNETFQDALGVEFGNRITTRDGVGGSTLPEQAARYALTPAVQDRTLIIMDGGLESKTTTEAQTVAALEAIISACGHDRWVYVEPSTTYVVGSDDRAAHDARVASILALVGPGHFIECMSAMQAAHDGSANDLADVANGLTPRSLRSDNLHENSAGSTVRAGVVKAFFDANPSLLIET